MLFLCASPTQHHFRYGGDPKDYCHSEDSQGRSNVSFAPRRRARATTYGQDSTLRSEKSTGKTISLLFIVGALLLLRAFLE
jgi:hypothetical protein